MGCKKSKIRRIPLRLDDAISDLQRKNNLKFSEAASLAGDILIGLKMRKKIIESMRREIEF